MLVGKNHVGGEGSSCWEEVMWLLQDGKLLQKPDFRTPQKLLLRRTDSRLSVRNINRSKLYVFAPRTFSN